MDKLSSTLTAWLLPLDRWFDPKGMRLWVVVLMLAYTVSGFLIAPYFLRQQIISTAGEMLQRPVTLDEIRINPFVLSVDLKEFSISETDGAALLQFDRLFVNFQLSSILRRAWTFDEITLEGANTRLIQELSGQTNIGRMLEGLNVDTEPATAEVTQAPELMPRLVIFTLQITGAAATFIDQTRAVPFKTDLGPINILINDLSTLPDNDGNQRVVIEAEADSRLEWTGSLKANPFSSKGHFKIGGPFVTTAHRYFAEDLNFDIPRGQVSVEFDYSIGVNQEDIFTASITGLGIEVQNLLVESLAHEPILDLPSLKSSGGFVTWPTPAAGLGTVTIEAPQLNTWLTPAGELNLSMLVNPSTDPETESVNTENSSEDTWALSLESLGVNGMHVTFNDRTLINPGTLAINDIDFSLQPLSNQPSAAGDFALHAGLAPAGSIDITGSVGISPDAMVKAEIQGKALAIAAVQHYLADFINLDVTDGDLNINAALDVDGTDAVSVSGDFSIENLALDDAGSNQLGEKRLIGWRSLAVNRFEFHSSPASLAVSEVLINAPFVRLRINEDASTNFKALLVNRPDSTATESQGMPLDITVGKIAVSDGSANFTDLALPFPFRTEITDLAGEVTTIATTSATPASVDIKGQVGSWGLAQIKGSLHPLDPMKNTDINILFRNIEFPELSAYTVKFAGRKIENGRLNLTLGYKVVDNAIQGQNSFVLSDLTLGEKVDYEGAMDLPLGLAIALLKGPDGSIDIDLPVTGNVNDPEFKISGVILKALANLFIRIVASPFALLGNLVDADTNDLGIIEFEPGSSAISPPAREQLNKLAQALALRPGLTLRVTGVIDPLTDRAALQTLSVENNLRQRVEIASQNTSEAMWTTLYRRETEAAFSTRFPQAVLSDLADQFTELDASHPTPAFDEQRYVSHLKARLIEAAEIGDDEMMFLANGRASEIVSIMTNEFGLGADKVTRSEITVEAKTSGNKNQRIPLKLELTTQ